MIGHQAVRLEMIQDALLHLGLARRAALPHALGDESEGDVVSRARVLGCFQVHGPLVIVPAGFEELHQVARRHNLHTEGAHQLHSAGVHARHVRVGVPRHIFHRDLACTLDQSGDARLQLLPAQVRLAAARQGVEGVRLDAVAQLACFAACWNVIEPAPRQHLLFAQSHHPARQDVEPAEVVEKPAIEALPLDGRLHGRKVKHEDSPPIDVVGTPDGVQMIIIEPIVPPADPSLKKEPACHGSRLPARPLRFFR